MKTLLYIIPLNLVSNLIGYLASLKKPLFLTKLAVKIFVNSYKINMEEAQMPIDSYNSVSELFTRNLSKGAREAKGEFVSPVDGTLRAYGKTNDSIIPVKGIGFTVDKLILDEDISNKFKNGSFFNIYLAPYNYHRIHIPCDAKLIKTIHIPGRLFPVNDFGFELFPDLFNLNERIVSVFETKFGLIALVAVGALNVGKITLPHLDFSSNQFNYKTKSFDLKKEFNILDQLAIFELGSSVVILTEQDFKYDQVYFVKQKIQLGDSLNI